MENTRYFYSALKTRYAPIHKILRKPSNFTQVPNDWHVVVADVESSTQAVEAGMHNQVNLAATGSVVAVINCVRSQLRNHEIPFFFGGDGATFLIPNEVIEEVTDALEVYRRHVLDNLKLNLRIGSVKVQQVYNDGFQISLAKAKINKYLTIPVVLGNGLKQAERFVKDHFVQSQNKSASFLPINLDGMECRWDEIKPRKEDHKVICLLVHCEDESQQAQVYADVLEIISLLFGSLSERQPITVSRLKLKATIEKIRKEMVARIGKNKVGYLLKHWLITYFGTVYFTYFKEGQQYLNKVSQLSDTIMFDGSFNTVMEGDAHQIEALTNYLDLLEKEGKIKYGIHATYASVMSCYVQDRVDNHIHFVDATEGGYTSAAVIYKSKLSLDPEELEPVLS